MIRPEKSYQQEQDEAFAKAVAKPLIIGFILLCSGMYIINSVIDYHKNFKHNADIQRGRE